MCAVHPNGDIEPILDRGTINGLGHHISATAAGEGWPIVEFDSVGFVGQIDRYNDAWG